MARGAFGFASLPASPSVLSFEKAFAGMWMSCYYYRQLAPSPNQTQVRPSNLRRLEANRLADSEQYQGIKLKNSAKKRLAAPVGLRNDGSCFDQTLLDCNPAARP